MNARLSTRFFSGLNIKGVLPIVAGTAVLWAIFTIANPRFLTAENLTNLIMQTAPVAVIAMGAAMVLLLGDIDLSLGSISGLTASVMGIAIVAAGVPGPLAMGAALIVGLILGGLQGTIIRVVGLPSFVVTLGGLLAWQGAQLAVLGDRGNVNITDTFIIDLATKTVPNAVAVAIWLLVLVLLTLERMLVRRRRSAVGLQIRPRGVFIASVAGTWVIAIAVLLVLVSHRGVPLIALIVMAVAACLHGVLTRTRFGRHVYAVGSNAEASRRSGIPVTRVVIVVFALAGGLAALGGVLGASRLAAVNATSGGGDLLLLAIAAAVIGGVSLFGGVGTVWNALLGALVIGTISNGMNLLSIPSSVRYMVTGAVLVLAVSIDALTRRRRARRA